jgi:hypothetical protein
MRLLAFLLLALLAVTASAQIYRWTDEKGAVHYSNSTPPPGVKAKRLDIEVKSAPEQAPPADDGCNTLRCQEERLEKRLARREAVEARLEAERAASGPRQPRGLEFRKYISIQRGMSEGELLGIAGEPDLLADQGAVLSAPTTVQSGRHVRAPGRAALAMRTYTYLPTVADPFTTTVTVVGGRVSDIERVRKF